MAVSHLAASHPRLPGYPRPLCTVSDGTLSDVVSFIAFCVDTPRLPSSMSCRPSACPRGRRVPAANGGRRGRDPVALPDRAGSFPQVSGDSAVRRFGCSVGRNGSVRQRGRYFFRCFCFFRPRFQSLAGSCPRWASLGIPGTPCTSLGSQPAHGGNARWPARRPRAGNAADAPVG